MDRGGTYVYFELVELRYEDRWLVYDKVKVLYAVSDINCIGESR